ncbi:MAG: integrase core domain-containing protein, partial [Limisphaerales bacterium]
MLDRELFLSLPEARVVLGQWGMDYNHRRPHGGLKRNGECSMPRSSRFFGVLS